MSWIEKILPRTKSPTKSNVPEGSWAFVLSVIITCASLREFG